MARAGSFVGYSVDTVDDLVDQIENNPTVAKRYSSHYGVAPGKLATYFRDNLKVIALSSPVQVRTYFISRNGRIASKQRVLPVGRRVYAVGGEILIETDCGNPVTRTLPPVETKVLGTTEVVPVLAPAVGAGPEVVEAFEGATARAVEAAVEPLSTAASAPSFLQIAQAVVPALAGLHYVQANRTTPVVPEPGTAATLALACSGLAAAAVRRRWRSR